VVWDGDLDHPGNVGGLILLRLLGDRVQHQVGAVDESGGGSAHLVRERKRGLGEGEERKPREERG